MDFVETVMLYYSTAYNSVLSALVYDRHNLAPRGAFTTLYYKPTIISSFGTTPLEQVHGHIGNEEINDGVPTLK